MKIVIDCHEIAQIVVNHLVATNKLKDDQGQVSVTWTFDGWNSALMIEEQ